MDFPLSEVTTGDTIYKNGNADEAYAVCGLVLLDESDPKTLLVTSLVGFTASSALLRHTATGRQVVAGIDTLSENYAYAPNEPRKTEEELLIAQGIETFNNWVLNTDPTTKHFNREQMLAGLLQDAIEFGKQAS